MTINRLLALFLVVVAGMGSVYLLPKQLGYQPVGIDLSLPEFLGAWWGRDVEVTQKEHDTLGYDTEFARKVYQSGSGDSVLASIVLSGQDMMTGIHRPERCMLAQGWNPGDSAQRAIEVPGVGRLKLTRLRNSRRAMDGPDGKPGALIENICYYWFIGASDVAATHGERVWLDSRDRVLKGINQRWGMVLISSEITKDRQKFGRSEQETDQVLQEFIKQLAPKILKENVRGSLASNL